MGDLRAGTEWVSRRDSDAQRKQSEVQNRDVERGRAQNEGHVAFGERSEGFERESEGTDLVKESRVGNTVVGDGVDEDVGGGVDSVSGGSEERESEVGEREGLRRRW